MPIATQLIQDRALKRRLSVIRAWQHAAHLLLHGIGFLASTLLMTWGLFVLFFLSLGGGSFDGFMHQLNNLTSRYVAAGPARIDAFLNMLAIAHLILSAAIIVFRRDHILPSRTGEGAHHG